MIDIYLTRGKIHAEDMTERVFSEALRKPSPAVTRNDRGKPVFVGDPRHLSLSHSGDYTVLALSDCLVGIDIQRLYIKRDPLALANRFFTPEETRIIGDNPPDKRTGRFLDIWAKKEAAVKAAGLGFDITPSSFSVLDSQLILEGLTLAFLRVSAPEGYTAWLAASEANPRVNAPVIIG